MAESMEGLKRSARCAEVSSSNIGEIVTLMGWVQKSRNKDDNTVSDNSFHSQWRRYCFLQQ